ncbi:MAG: carbonic anhydrase [Scytonema sp. PMC 1069.18]|nr:carbonic anhydrase [Scytonema sp. PMC 1069.18]MEC4886918.1 carbonic anhydrase [Scytonema sp. PMC 1070.18]
MSRINGFVGRRNFLKFVGIASLTTASNLMWDTPTISAFQKVVADANPANPNPVSPKQALQRLLDGNKRFVTQQRHYPDQSLERLRQVSEGQYPFATVLGCADSRVPAEVIFDQGLGNLFVVRVAGNIASDTAIGSLEYATSVLGCQLIVVLGHERCGAVKAALQENPAPGRISFIVEGIKPALAEVKLNTGNGLNNAIVANIEYQAKKLQERSTILAKLIQEEKLQIVGAFYDLDTGKVFLK